MAYSNIRKLLINLKQLFSCRTTQGLSANKPILSNNMRNWGQKGNIFNNPFLNDNTIYVTKITYVNYTNLTDNI